MFLAVILLSATGYLSYRNLSSIVSSIHLDVKTELLSIREISMDLEKAQNSIRIYKITGDTLDLAPYYNIISNIDEKVSRLRSECVNDTVLLRQTDTISKLIEENIVIWNKLLYLNNNLNVVEYLTQLSEQLNSDSEINRKTEKNILKRVFSRSNKSKIDEKKLITDIKEVKLQDSIINETLIRKESQLAATGSEIKEQFYELNNKIESEISRNIESKAFAANILARKTYIWLAMFSLSGTLLAIIVMFIIIRYIRKTHAIQIALQNSKDEAEKLTRTKEMFMANMSHEIRTPVTAILGFTEQLLHEPLDENTARSLKIIKSSSDHLNNIINDILDFSKLQNDKLLLEKVHFSISQILEDVYALFENKAMRNITTLSYSVSPDTPAVLLGDPYRLKQILINLVSNSVKFTKNGKVHFMVNCIKKESGEIELILEVTDTGIGIDESKLNLIFEDFTQEEMSTSRKYGGTGLGLSIVKKLMELHNGRIECTSRKNHGTRVVCHLPYSTGDEKQVKPDFVPPLYIPQEIKNLKILVVDDEEYNRLLFKAILDRWEVKFNEASDGTEALKILETNQYDIVFMDARMPGIDGLKTTQFIREQMNISESVMPVICISAVSVKEDQVKYKEAGMNAFLPKPFTEEMLLTTILSAIRDYTSVSIIDAKNEEKIMPSTPGKINLINLYHISGGDEHFVKQMLTSFIESTEKGMNEIQKAVISGNFDQIADLAHKILPPCRHIGALDLYNSLKKIEENSQNMSDKITLEKLVQESIREFEEVNELIMEHVTKIK
jgi:signal transduction histidine kinase/CheY-like chemotaxis protein/HPt (histidine-containing phosphotransfer) domain-containing protein/CHASE3 domain sensor protein